ncbi:threonine--tRNA ligase, partial [candidate division WWE3 bacterium]|nr:threonine--tRNA ligase [candidate division WWE3 bacterium]
MAEKTDYAQFNNPDLAKMRHTAEHLLHDAARILWPHIKLAMGPATDDGYYFDFDPIDESGNTIKVSEADFEQLEEKMQWLKSLKLPISRQEISLEEAKKLFSDNPYKLDTLDTIAQRGDSVSVYWTGDSSLAGENYVNLSNGFYTENDQFVSVDLCAGPHVDNTSQVGEFKLLSVAGAYWHGDEKNKMLTRIYGTAFDSAEALHEYLHFQEEAKRRDHKVLGPQFDLFTFSEKVGGGLPLWTPKGTLLRNLLDSFVWELRQAKGYEKVEIPHITKKDLFETSGHWDKFKDELFRITTREGHEFAMKPMNCPFHTQIYDRKPHSYREMPQRYANTTMVYRDEQSGELAGLSRVRSITQDDAHVFCRESQVKGEALAIWDIIEQFYKGAGFSNLKVRLSLHDPEHMENYLGDEETWLYAENQLRDLIKEKQADFFEAPGEAAFYGPKIDFMGYDSLGREWQVATIQVDRNMPERFDLSCINEDGEKERVVMLHAAIMGSIERFMS